MKNFPPTEWIFKRFACKWTPECMTTFAYWLCAVEKACDLPPIDDLASAMSTQCDAEEQTTGPGGFGEIQPFTPSPLIPLAPVTFADRWSPFPVATEILGRPAYTEFEADPNRAVAHAVWKPKWLGALDVAGCSKDEAHFRYLLRLAAAKAERLERDLYVFGTIGWAYREEEVMNPEVALAMLEYGYVFSDRMAR